MNPATAESEMIAAWLAINPPTKCPPRYVAFITGAQPFTDGAQSADIQQQRADQRGRGGLSAADRAATSAQRKAEHDARATAGPTKGEATAAQRSASMKAAVLASNRAKASKRASKLGRILREIGGDFTPAGINAAAATLRTNPRAIRTFLRENGHGDKLPAHVTSFVGPADRIARDADACRLITAGRTLAEVAEKFGICIRQVGRIIQRHGVKSTAKNRYQKANHPQDEWRRLYESGESFPIIGAQYGVSAGTVRNMVIRAGGTPRSPKEAKRLADAQRMGVRLTLSI